MHFKNNNKVQIRRVSSNSIASNELLLDNQLTNTIGLNTNSNCLQSGRTKLLEEDSIINKNRTLWFGISSKTILYKEKDRNKNKSIRPKKANENKNVTFMNNNN